MSVSNSKFKVVWGAIERSGETLWTRVGLAWEGKGGVLFARLNAFPLTGRICVRGEDGEASGPAQFEEVCQ